MTIIRIFILIMGILSFLGLRGQGNKKSTYDILTPELANKFRNELIRDSAKDFESEFVRTTNLENRLIHQYGFSAIQLIYEDQNSANYFPLGALPADCPWNHLNGMNIRGCVLQNFKPIANKLPDLIKTMQDRCAFIYAEKKDETWQLHYLLTMKLHDDRDYFVVYTGGAPLANAQPNKILKTYGWEVPKDLKTFYTVHNGFAEINHEGILANEYIRVMAEIMDPIAKEDEVEPEGYLFKDLLEFYPDGGGNAQCFFKNKGNITVDWDHETWEISDEISFWDFINDRMSVIDEE